MKIINNKLESELNIRTEKNFPMKGIEFIDINPLVIQNNVFEEIISKFLDEIKRKKIDYIISPEARGFLLGSVIANRKKIGFIPVRKKGKMPPTTIEKQVSYKKEYGEDILELPKLVNTEYKGKKFYIIDDIYATGSTARTISKSIEELGGELVGVGVVLNIIELNKDKDVFSLIDVNEE